MLYLIFYPCLSNPRIIYDSYFGILVGDMFLADADAGADTDTDATSNF